MISQLKFWQRKIDRWFVIVMQFSQNLIIVLVENLSMKLQFLLLTFNYDRTKYL